MRQKIALFCLALIGLVAAQQIAFAQMQGIENFLSKIGPDGKLPPDLVKELNRRVFFGSELNQLPIQVLALEDPRFLPFKDGDLEGQVHGAMGFVDPSPNSTTSGYTVDPQTGLTLPPVGLKLKLIPSLTIITANLADGRTLNITTGLISKIVKTSIERRFGSVTSYLDWLTELRSISLDEFDRRSQLGVAWGPSKVVDGRSLPTTPIDEFSKNPVSRASLHFMEIRAKLLFVAKHEEAHFRFKHTEIPASDCQRRAQAEMDADAFASEQLSFLVYPPNGIGYNWFDSDLQQLWKGFNLFLTDFDDSDLGVDCSHRSVADRVKLTQIAFDRKIKSRNLQ